MSRPDGEQESSGAQAAPDQVGHPRLPESLGDCDVAAKCGSVREKMWNENNVLAKSKRDYENETDIDVDVTAARRLARS